jgi:hypothetical protein
MSGWRPGSIIAQRFSAGTTKHLSLHTSVIGDSSVPGGTRPVEFNVPSVKTLGYFQNEAEQDGTRNEQHI